MATARKCFFFWMRSLSKLANGGSLMKWLILHLFIQSIHQHQLISSCRNSVNTHTHTHNWLSNAERVSKPFSICLTCQSLVNDDLFRMNLAIFCISNCALSTLYFQLRKKFAILLKQYTAQHSIRQHIFSFRAIQIYWNNNCRFLSIQSIFRVSKSQTSKSQIFPWLYVFLMPSQAFSIVFFLLLWLELKKKSQII